MTPIKITKAMLPNLPEEVFEMFIVPLNETALNIFDSQPGGRWKCHFAGRSVREFNELQWRKSGFILKVLLDLLHPVSFNDIYGLIKYCSIENITIARTLFPGYPVDSRERLAWHKSFIVKTGCLCAPILCIGTNEGFRLLDGIHRLSAAFLLATWDLIPIDAWIGK